MKTISLATMTILLAASLLAPTKIGLSYSGGLSDAEIHRLVALRQAGLTGDQSQINMMRNIIKNPYATNVHTFAPSVDELLVLTALRSLTRLAAVAAIPDIDLLTTRIKRNYPSLASFAYVQEARLKAKQEAGTNSDLSLQIADFDRILGLTPDTINTGAANYKKQYYANPEGRRLPVPVEVYAMREIADMVYQSHAQDFQSILGVSQVDFSLDYPSALKIRLAPLLEEARAKALTDLLVNAQILGTDEDYAMQLLADEGPIASQAIADQFGEVRKHRNQYSEINISGLFRVLGMIGDSKQSSVIAQFKADPDINVRQESEAVCRELQPGLASLNPHTVGY